MALQPQLGAPLLDDVGQDLALVGAREVTEPGGVVERVDDIDRRLAALDLRDDQLRLVVRGQRDGVAQRLVLQLVVDVGAVAVGLDVVRHRHPRIGLPVMQVVPIRLAHRRRGPTQRLRPVEREHPVLPDGELAARGGVVDEPLGYGLGVGQRLGLLAEVDVGAGPAHQGHVLEILVAGRLGRGDGGGEPLHRELEDRARRQLRALVDRHAAEAFTQQQVRVPGIRGRLGDQLLPVEAELLQVGVRPPLERRQDVVGRPAGRGQRNVRTGACAAPRPVLGLVGVLAEVPPIRGPARGRLGRVRKLVGHDAREGHVVLERALEVRDRTRDQELRIRRGRQSLRRDPVNRIDLEQLVDVAAGRPHGDEQAERGDPQKIPERVRRVHGRIPVSVVVSVVVHGRLLRTSR